MTDAAWSVVFDQRVGTSPHFDATRYQQLRAANTAVLRSAADTRARARRTRATTRRLRRRLAVRRDTGAWSESAARGRPGGLARAMRLRPERRVEIARAAARARWTRAGSSNRPPDPRLGGLARAAAMTPEQRREIARKASEAARGRRA